MSINRDYINYFQSSIRHLGNIPPIPEEISPRGSQDSPVGSAKITNDKEKLVEVIVCFVIVEKYDFTNTRLISCRLVPVFYIFSFFEELILHIWF